MQSLEEKQRSATIPYLVGRILFVLFMLCALDGMHQAWAVTHGWFRRYELIAPWFFLGTAGFGVWINTFRGKMKRDFSGGLLMMIGFAAQFGYEAMGRLASTHF